MGSPEWNWCGICCVQMVLLSLGRGERSLRELYDEAFAAGVFRMDGGKVLGAYHRELAEYVRERLGFARAWTARGLSAGDVADLVYGIDPQYVVASVSPEIRDLAGPPPGTRGGHFVLVYGVEEAEGGRMFLLHNSAGFASAGTQRGVRVPERRFAECFSGNAVVIDDAPWRRSVGREPDESDDPDLCV